jgi:anaphase-promoting complex subunit 2
VAGSAAPPAAPTAAVIDEKEAARRTVYWQYIRGMLTNASATMPLGQMAMMMKMLITDGFKWSNEELQEFLGEKVADGEMEIVGGKYRLVRK